MKILSSDVDTETQRLHGKLRKLGWTIEDCELIAPTTFEINELKQAQNAIVLAHSYQTPDIMYGVGDYVGGSYDKLRQALEKCFAFHHGSQIDTHRQDSDECR
ncbi:MAG: quinolinate synthase NadA [Gammaproteobacteria bacterium]|nr:quinolinate synthase NadA [Gammaproteobacteria bacterium]